MRGFKGEGRDDGTVIAVKNHEAFNLDLMHAYKRAILIYRRPQEAVLAEYKRRRAGHTGQLDLKGKLLTGKCKRYAMRSSNGSPDSKVHGAYMGPTWGRQDPGWPHVGPMKLATKDSHSLKNIVILVEIFITGCTGSCRFDNSQCKKWRKFRKRCDISVSVLLHKQSQGRGNGCLLWVQHLGPSLLTWFNI